MSAPVTTLIGRDASVAAAAALLRRDDVRILTITGPGGIGKSRLAQAVAIETADRFADGVVLVPLQSIRDSGHVIGTIARSLGLFDGEGDLEQRLVLHLEGRRILLVLDNFEQVVDAAPSLAAVVAASPDLKVAVTSRTRLRVSGEQELPLDPLARDDAVTLFLDRARAVLPDMRPDEANLDAIRVICERLDCLPLALELAAARVKLLAPTAMLGRLERSLELLTSGSRDAPARHRALRETISWSYELLNDDQKALFRRLSVFVGGCSLEATEEVCGGDLDSLGSLVDESLLRAEGERFGMLETIREYASELLQVTPEANATRRAHAAHYLGLAHAAASGRAASDQAKSRTTLETDNDNLRAALRFSLDEGDPLTALELCAVLWRFWFERGYLSEGRLWLDASLATSPDASLARARVLSGNGVLAHYQGDYERAEALCQEALTLSLTLDDGKGIAEAQTGIGLVHRARGDYPEAEALFREASSATRASTTKQTSLAESTDSQCTSSPSEMTHRHGRSSRTAFLGSAASATLTELRSGSSPSPLPAPRARSPTREAQGEESLAILRAVGDRRTLGKVLWCLAGVNADLGDAETAAAQFEESLTLFVEFGDRWFCVIVLESIASLAASSGEIERAVSLLGAADAVLENIGVPLPARFRARHDQILTTAHATLGDARFVTTWDAGKRLSLGETIELVGAAVTRPDRVGHAETPADLATPDGLTAREIDVLALVADGRTDAEIAERLVVSVRTVHAHLRSIYRKIDLHTRSAATRYALEHGLAAEPLGLRS